MEQQCSVIFHIRFETAIGFMLLQEPERRLLNGYRELIKFSITFLGVEFLACSRQAASARAPHPIDAMSEAHQPFTPFQPGLNHSLSSICCSDLKNHVEGRPWSAAVKWAFERADRARDGRNNVGVRRNDDARRKS